MAIALAALRSMAQKSADKLLQHRGPIIEYALGIALGKFIFFPIVRHLIGPSQAVMHAELSRKRARIDDLFNNFELERKGYLKEMRDLRARLAAIDEVDNKRNAGGVGHAESSF